MNKKRMFIGLGLFWAIILMGFIGYKEFTLRTGEEVLLRTVPVDPRDLFRGDYVILRYEISTVSLPPTQDVPFDSGDSVYVALDNKREFGVTSGVFKSAPAAGLYIKGKVVGTRPGGLHIEYGIESYFVPEGEGMPIERSRNVHVKVAIDAFGMAVIKALIVDGEEVQFVDKVN